MAIKNKIFKLNHKKDIEIPVLLICFDRIKELEKTLKLLKKYKVKNLYIFKDGYDGHITNLVNKHSKIKIILENLKKKKIAKINFQNKNLGKRFGPPKAISWFFKYVKMGVIIEDDTLPSKSFLLMSEILLKEHKNDKKIFQICGSSSYLNDIDSRTYYSSIPGIHGWATWRNRWKLYSQNIGSIKDLFYNKNFNKNVFSFINKLYWIDIFKKYKYRKIETWDYPLVYFTMIKNYYCIKPTTNMITNIGYRKFNRLAFRKRYEINYFNNLKNIKNQFKDEKKKEAWIFGISIRYKISLILKYIIGYYKN